MGKANVGTVRKGTRVCSASAAIAGGATQSFTLPFRCNYFRVFGLHTPTLSASYMTWRIDGAAHSALSATPVTSQGVIQFGSGLLTAGAYTPPAESRVISEGFQTISFLNGSADTAVFVAEFGMASLETG